jgi:hypothetical protein
MWLAMSLYAITVMDHRFAFRRAPRRSSAAFFADSVGLDGCDSRHR